MMLIDRLTKIWGNRSDPFLIIGDYQLTFLDVVRQKSIDLTAIKSGDVVAIIGDFNPISIYNLLRLIELGAIIVPLTVDTEADHEYFFDIAGVDYILNSNYLVPRVKISLKHELIEGLRRVGSPGLVLFSSGSTGRPKAILHDLTLFLKRYETPRPAMRTLSFLLFDHIGGINTLLHTLFNKGVVVAPESRAVDSVLNICDKFSVEVLPVTPTFLRMLLLSGVLPNSMPKSIKVITYGTERMDQLTLNALCELLPLVDFRQTYGMSELGIVRVKSRSRDSLLMKVGGEGVKIRVSKNNTLEIKSESRMLGYLNAQSPFNYDGWYDTKDIVREEDEFIEIIGRANDVINVGGLKFMASEVERVVMLYPGIAFAKAIGRMNPITGQHVELKVHPAVQVFNKSQLIEYLKLHLQPHMIPRKVTIENIDISHRFKRL
jgi:long-chain acyl-CoA synthetase